MITRLNAWLAVKITTSINAVAEVICVATDTLRLRAKFTATTNSIFLGLSHASFELVNDAARTS
jgi:hypothetical protein